MKNNQSTSTKTTTNQTDTTSAPLCTPIIHSLRLNVAIEIVLFLAIGLTPLLFTPLTSELFEFPKMIFVYLLAIIGLLLIGIHMHQQCSITHIHTPLNRLIIVFAYIFTLSTILSIDPYTSIMGYYSRFNGGFASLAAYLILFYLTLIYLTDRPDRPANEVDDIPNAPLITRKSLRLIWAWLLSSTIVSIWAILEHFGTDPSCYILRGTWEATCWVQDVQARVFATFGQPNWLAAYAVFTIPLAFALLAQTSAKISKMSAAAIIILNYAAFWYTYSRSGWIGLAVALAILLPWLLKGRVKSLLPWLAGIAIACALISSSSLSLASQRTATSLESGNLDTSTGQIRLLVWKGSLETIQHFPLFGSGPETFAFSFLPQRPTELNNTTEWNFLYNKAHNDILQMAVTTGIVGVLAWLTLYASVFIFAWNQQILSLPLRPLNGQQLVSLGLIAGLSGVFAAQLLGFSVVTTSLLFWLSLALIIAPASTATHLQLPNVLGRSAIPAAILAGSIVFMLLLGSYTIAEVLASQAASRQGSDLWLSTRQYHQATLLNPFEPSYHQNLALNYAYLAQNSESNFQRNYIQSSLRSAQQAEQRNPHNLLILKSLVFTYQQLAMVDSQYLNQAIRVAQTAARLDSSDAVIQQDLVDLYLQTSQLARARQAADRLVTIRPHAATSYLYRAKYYIKLGNLESARDDLYTAKQLEPTNLQVQQEMNLLNDKVSQ